MLARPAFQAGFRRLARGLPAAFLRPRPGVYATDFKGVLPQGQGLDAWGAPQRQRLAFTHPGDATAIGQ
jgi:hypothetical protein